MGSRRAAHVMQPFCRLPWLRAALAALALVAGLACVTTVKPMSFKGVSPNRPLLWSAVAPGSSEGSLYLLGSLHMGTPALLDLGPAVASAWADASELVVEVDISRLDPNEVIEIIQQSGFLPSGRTLRDFVSAETWAMLEAFAAERGLPVSLFEPLKPWRASTLVAVAQLRDSGLAASYGVDQQLIDRASRTDKPIVELESFRSQMEMFDGLDWKVQTLMLDEVLVKSDRAAEDAREMVERWRQGDEEALVRFFFGSLEEHPEFEPLYEKVFFERNEAMSEALESLTRDGKTRLAVVGAGHMVGPRGIPALLESRGFQVERVGTR